MTQGETQGEATSAPQPPTAKVQRHGRFSWVWLIPIVSAGLVAYLAYTSYVERGPLVTLVLATADDLKADETQVKHKAVPLGTVQDIRLADDMRHVIVHVRMTSEAEPMLTDHARFWVVRPRLSAGSIAGLETLVSGAYIEVDPGAPGGKKQHEFQGLAEPPGRQSDEPGRVFVLKAARLGSLSDGAPVYNRDVEVGELLGYELGENADKVSLRIFVRAPFDRLVHAETRFWNASGLSVITGPDGMHVELESIQSLLSGGIAFETSAANRSDPAADDNATFELYGDKARADSASYRENIPYVTYFETSIQGLSRGSPVQLFGVQVGSVTDVTLAYDPRKRRMIARVAFDIQPERVSGKGRSESVPQGLRGLFSEVGLRAQLESSSLLTGAKDIAILYAPDVKATDLPREGDATVLPGQGGGLDGLTASLSDVATKVDKIPFDQIGQNMNDALQSLQRLATQIDTSATPALQRLPAVVDAMAMAAESANGALGAGGYGENSEFKHGVERTLDQVGDAARSVRQLTDYLDRHPEALLRGRSSNAGAR